MSSFDIIIINYNGKDLTVDCINSIRKTTENANIIVIDNASTDGSVEALSVLFPEIKIIRNEKNYGYAAAVNIGVKHSKNEFLIISNNDVIYQENSLNLLLKMLKDNPDVAVAGPQQIYSDGKRQDSYGDFPGIKLGIKKVFFVYSLFPKLLNYLWKINIRPKRKRKISGYIDGAVMAIRKSDFEQVKGFDEDYFFFTEELDFCYRINKLNKKIIFQPTSLVIHLRGGGNNFNGLNEKNIPLLINSKILFCKKHLSKFCSTFYILSEIYISLILLMIWKIIAVIKGKNHSKVSEKVKISDLIYQNWKKNYKIPLYL